MVLVQCSPQRWHAHCEIARTVNSPGAPRNHLWRFAGEGEAVVRLLDEPLDIPENDEVVAFRIDCAPVFKFQGKRQRFPHTEEWLTNWFVDRIGDALEVLDISARPMSFTIQRENEKAFTRPCARVTGTARVVNRDELERVMRRGLGEAKAYGFGLLEVERAKS